MTIWLPDLTERPGPKYLALADAIAEAADRGDLAEDEKLPAQRDLAYDLGLSLSTVTRGYAEAGRRGLVYGEVGRGTFVRGAGAAVGDTAAALFRPAGSDGLIDLTMNLPTMGEAPRRLSEALTRLGREPDLSPLLDYRAEDQAAAQAAAGADWIGRLGLTAETEDVLVTVGAQHGVLVSLMAATRPGDVVLTEDLTYPPMKQIARHLDLKLHPVAMDADGLLPEALDEACRSVRASVLYCMPTLHSPTTATMPEDRRRLIADVARRYDLRIIEDDVFGFLPDQRPPPLAAYAPDRTLFLTSVSKSLAPWLRVGFVRAPETLKDAVLTAVHMSCWMPPPLMADIARRWIVDGTADHLNSWQRGETRARQRIAARVLSNLPHKADPQGLHVWLPLPAPWRADDLRSAAEKRGVKILTGEVFAVGQQAAPQAVRLSLGCEADRERMTKGLAVVAELLEVGAGSGPSVV